MNHIRARAGWRGVEKSLIASYATDMVVIAYDEPDILKRWTATGMSKTSQRPHHSGTEEEVDPE